MNNLFKKLSVALLALGLGVGTAYSDPAKPAAPATAKAAAPAAPAAPADPNDPLPASVVKLLKNSAKLTDAQIDGIRKLAAFIKNVGTAMADSFKNMNYQSDKFEFKLGKVTMDKTDVNIAIVYKFPFAGSDAPDIAEGFKAIIGELTLTNVDGTPVNTMPPAMSKLALIPGGPAAPKDILPFIAVKAGPAGEFLMNMLKLQPDTVFMMKLMMLGNYVKKLEGAKAAEKMEIVGNELLSLLAIFSSTPDMDATKAAAIKAKPELAKAPPADMLTFLGTPEGAKCKISYKSTGPSTIIKRFITKFPPFAKVVEAITFDVPSDIYYEVQNANMPPSAFVKAIGTMRVGNTVMQGRIDSCNSDIVPMITKDLNFFDRRLLLKAYKKFVDELMTAQAAKKNVKTLAENMASLFTNTLQNMQDSGVFGAGKPGVAKAEQPKQQDLIAEMTKYKAVVDTIAAGNVPEAAPKDAVVEVEKTFITRNLVQYIDYMWARFNSVMGMPLVDDKDYVPSDLPMSKQDVLKVVAALFLRVSRDSAKAAKGYQTDPEGAAKYAELVTPADAVKKSVAAKLASATKALAANKSSATAKKAVADYTAENMKAQKDYTIAMAKFKNAAIMNFSYPRIPGNNDINEPLAALIMKTFTNMIRRVPAFQELINALNPYTNRPPINLDLNTVLAKMSGDAAAEQAAADEAMAAGLENMDMSMDSDMPAEDAPVPDSDAPAVEAPAVQVSDDVQVAPSSDDTDVPAPVKRTPAKAQPINVVVDDGGNDPSASGDASLSKQAPAVDAGGDAQAVEGW